MAWFLHLLALVSIAPIPGFAEPFSSLTHLAGAVVAAVASVWLLRRGWEHGGRVAALGLFAFSVVFMFSMSGVYHLLAPNTGGRAVLQRLDHAAIFVLIAGSFTATHGILFKGILRWGMISLVWVLVATAIPLKTVFFSSMNEWLSLMLYIGLGWLGLISGLLLWRRYGFSFMAPVLWGGIAYTLGAALEFMRWPNPIPGVVHAHELFHLLVIVGVAWHWRFIQKIATDPPPVSEIDLRPEGTDSIGLAHTHSQARRPADHP